MGTHYQTPVAQAHILFAVEVAELSDVSDVRPAATPSVHSHIVSGLTTAFYPVDACELVILSDSLSYNVPLGSS